MFKELKESLIPISQRIAEATKELKDTNSYDYYFMFYFIYNYSSP